jgi:hypothetical protein
MCVCCHQLFQNFCPPLFVNVDRTKYDPSLAEDVQYVYINSLVIDRGKLMVENERGDKYSVDLQTRAVKKTIIQSILLLKGSTQKC